jgi:hypothetical protein
VKQIIKLEEAAFFALSILAFAQLDLAWWWYLLLLFTPELSMLGYMAGPRLGALLYNLVHHRALAVLVYVSGVYLSYPSLMLAGIILFGHSSLDRAFGYGLKYADSFQNTHLGKIGPSAS